MVMTAIYRPAGLPIQVWAGYGKGSPIMLDMGNEELRNAIKTRDERLFDALDWAILHHETICQALNAAELASCYGSPAEAYFGPDGCIDTDKVRALLQNPFLELRLKDALRVVLQNGQYRPPPAEHVREPRAGYVYLFKDRYGLYKIGRSLNPWQRAKDISQPNYLIRVICTLKTNDAFLLERELHERFADKRVEGEWFELDEADVDYFKRMERGKWTTDFKGRNAAR